jgi:hypothetical protein
MHRNPGRELANETNRLLSELELALDHCSTIRAIARHRELLYDLESLTGPSPRTRTLRAEIHQLEQRLGDERAAAAALPRVSLLPV